MTDHSADNPLDWVDEEDLDELDFRDADKLFEAHCYNCGYISEDDAIFCEHCNSRLREEPNE